MLMNLISKPLHVLRRSITQRLSKIPPCRQTQLSLALTITKRTHTLALDRPFDFLLHAPLHKRTRTRRRLGPAATLEPRRKHVPARGARCHLKLDVPRAVDEFQHGVRRIVPRAAPELVYARVAARTVCVTRREGFEEFGREGGLQEERGGFLPGWVCAFFP
jgi:hypothetical protein